MAKPTIAEELPPYRRIGKWVQCGVAGIGFPKEPMEVTFQGKTLYLIPGEPQSSGRQFGDSYPLVALEHTGMSFEDGQRILSAFVNSLAWVRRAAIRPAIYGGGSRVHSLGEHGARAEVDALFELNYLPDPADEKARLALAFYREGLSLNSVAYQCLSYFKVLNITLGKPQAQIDWIDANLEKAKKLEPYWTKDWEKKAGFDASKQTAGQYLYASNRSAIAHAFAPPYIDPDDPDHLRRLENDIRMVKALAELFIEQEFGVKSATTVWREHLYELAGFSELFGGDLVARIKAGEEVPVTEFPPLPTMSVRLAFKDWFPTLEGMRVEVLDCAEGRVNLKLDSSDDCTSVLLVLDYQAGRLDFELFHHMAVCGGKGRGSAIARLNKLRFADAYLRNGKLEIWAGGRRLSRKDAFLPQNIDLGTTHQNYLRMIAAAEVEVQGA